MVSFAHLTKETPMQTITSLPRIGLKRPRLAGWPRLALHALRRRLGAWRRNRDTRLALERADPRMLADLGISPAQAEFELDLVARLYRLR